MKKALLAIMIGAAATACVDDKNKQNEWYKISDEPKVLVRPHDPFSGEYDVAAFDGNKIELLKFKNGKPVVYGAIDVTQPSQPSQPYQP